MLKAVFTGPFVVVGDPLSIMNDQNRKENAPNSKADADLTRENFS